MKWLARIILALIVAALFVPWHPAMVPLTDDPDTRYVPFGVVLLGLVGVLLAVVGLVLALIWLMVKAGILR